MGSGNPDLLCEMLATRGELLLQLKGLRLETAWTRPEISEWSVAEVLHHVADVDQLMVRRFGEIREGKADLSGLDSADWEKARSDAERGGLSGILRRLQAARMEVLHSVSEQTGTDLDRWGRHPKYGPKTGRQLVEMIIEHDHDHAQQIAKTRAVVEC